MMSDIDLSAYFMRISYMGPQQPSLALLRALHATHHAAIPYENIDVLLRKPVSLDAEALQAKMIFRQRGGYCFEQNTLFYRVLAAMGLFMLPPSLVSLPLKLILFVLADGWLHVAAMLLRSFGPGAG